MSDQPPVEPSEVLDRDGRAVPPRTTGLLPALPGRLLPASLRAAAAGPLLAASAVALAAVATARVVEVAVEAAGRLARGAGQDAPVGPPPPLGGVRITVTRVEIRWPS